MNTLELAARARFKRLCPWRRFGICDRCGRRAWVGRRAGGRVWRCETCFDLETGGESRS